MIDSLLTSLRGKEYFAKEPEPELEPSVFGPLEPEPEPEPLKKKYQEPEPLGEKIRSRSRFKKKSGAGAANKFAGSPALILLVNRY